jgi:uncharacterized protein DUF4226
VRANPEQGHRAYNPVPIGFSVTRSRGPEVLQESPRRRGIPGVGATRIRRPWLTGQVYVILACMLLDELVAEIGRALADARRLFGPAPADGAWSSSTQDLETARQGVASAGRAAAVGWEGASATSHRAANREQLRAMDNTVAGDIQIAPAVIGSGQAAATSARGMDNLITETRSVVAAIVPNAATTEGKRQLVMYLQGQLDRARELLRVSEQRDRELAASIESGTAQCGGAVTTRPTDTRGTTSATSWKPNHPRRKPIVVEPGHPGPPVNPNDPWIEVGPQSGIFVPKSELPGLKVLAPHGLGPPMYPDSPWIELIPSSGVWAPKSDFPHAVFQTPQSLGPFGCTEWLPGSGIWIPSEQLRPAR